MINKVILVGRVGKDPVLKQTPAGTSVTSFGLATSKSWMNKEEGQWQEKTTWHNVVCWGKLAEVAAQYATKGKQVYIEGEIDNRSYEKDGVKKYISEVVAHTLKLLGSKPKEDGDTPAVATEEEGLPF